MKHKEPFIKDMGYFEKHYKEYGFNVVEITGMYTYYEHLTGNVDIRIFKPSTRVSIWVKDRAYMKGKNQAEKYVEFMKDIIEWRYD